MEKTYILLYTNLETGYRKIIDVFSNLEDAEYHLDLWASDNCEEFCYTLTDSKSI